MDGPTAIVPVTVVPNILPSDASLVGKVFQAEGGNAIEVFGLVNNGAGRLTLYRNLDGRSIEWYPVNVDANAANTCAYDVTKPTEAPGFFSKVFSTGDLTAGSVRAWYVVLCSTLATDFTALYVAGRRQTAP